jgi:hypothetical protein
MKTLVFRSCVLPILLGRKPLPSLDLFEHKVLEVLSIIYGLGWRNLEPSFGIVLHRLHVVTKFYVVHNKISLLLIHFHFLIHDFNRLSVYYFESIMQIEMIMFS